MSQERFILLGLEEAGKKGYEDPEGYLDLLEQEWREPYEDVLVDTHKNRIVFIDGSHDSPEDNYMFRWYGGLIDILNEVANENQ